jgi:hypothetical protein
MTSIEISDFVQAGWPLVCDEPELSTSRVKDLDQFSRDCEVFLIDQFVVRERN